MENKYQKICTIFQYNVYGVKVNLDLRYSRKILVLTKKNNKGKCN
jgi:hypothetical protein